MRRLRRFLKIGVVFMIGAFALPITSPVLPQMAPPAYAGNWFKKHIGDGWKHGKWIAGIPDVKPKTAQELLPVCWGQPQNCRGGTDAKPEPQKVAARVEAKFVAQFRCQCAKSTDVGDNHGDVTIPYTSEISIQDAQQKALNEYHSGVDLCQKYSQTPSTDMRMVQGSGGFVN